MKEKRKHKRRSKLKENIDIVILADGVRIEGKLIDISFKGLAVKVKNQLTPDQKKINIKFGTQKDGEFLKGIVVGNNKDVLQILLDDLSDEELFDLLTVYYPNSGQKQLRIMAEMLNRSNYL